MRPPTPVAAIDIGTNTVLMLVARAGTDAPIPLGDFAEITRLGWSVDRTGRLDDAAILRTLSVLETFAARARTLGVRRIAAVATSAVRDAANGPEFRSRAEEILGGNVNIATGEREATLTFAGALGGLSIARGARVAVIDVGGGSTELVIGRAGVSRGIEWSHSYDVGSVRLTERHLHDDPPAAASLVAVREDAARTFQSRPPPSGPFEAVVAIAGTATTYAAIDLGLARYADAPPHGHAMTIDTIRALTASLASVPLARRRERAGLDPRRADVIVAGGVVLTEALASLDATTMLISDRGVRWGLAAELLESAGVTSSLSVGAGGTIGENSQKTR